MRFKKYRSIIFLLLISLLPLFDLFSSGLPITHDGQDHVARIANFYQNLSEGNFIPRWAGNLNWGYGHPILMFLYPLPSYASSIFHFLGFSLVDSLKIVFGLAFILSGVFMFLWLREFLGEAAGFFGGVLYMFAPYRFVDLYVRGAIGEHLAFVFPPLIFYFLLKLSKRYSWWYFVGGTFSLAGLILSHNAISLMFLPLILFYASYLFWQTKNKKLIASCYLLIVILGLGLAAFFWLPAFFEGRYTLRDIVTGGDYLSRFVQFQNFLYGSWSYGIAGQFSVQVGIVQWLVLILSLPTAIIFYQRKSKFWLLSASGFLIFWLTLFLMMPSSNFIWKTLTILQKFQFPWRFLSVTVFITAFLGSLVIFVIPKKFKLAIYCLLVIALLWVNHDYWRAKDYLLKPEGFYAGIYKGTTDTGESSPLWSVRFMEKEPAAHLEIIKGNAQIKELERKITRHSYEITASEPVRVRENTLYFPGWEVLIDGKKTDVEFQDPQNRGLMTFFVPAGKHEISVIFKETRLRGLANLISLISVLLLSGAIILKVSSSRILKKPKNIKNRKAIESLIS